MAPKAASAPAAKKTKTPRVVKKQIGGDKNGGSRMVAVKRLPRYYPTDDKPRDLIHKQKSFNNHKHSLRSTITPGSVLIIVAGRHKGKRVVFLKQLNSGLLLVTGPYHLNNCPLRRINQIYVMATKTSVNIKGVKIPDKLNDEYFSRSKLRKPKQTEGEIFDTKKEKYEVSEDRKTVQKEVDKQILDVIRKSPNKKLMFGYLGSLFALRAKEFPHKMVF